MGSREKGMIAVLVLLAYGFLFYQFNYLETMPKIDRIKAEIVEKENDLASLRKDKERIGDLKAELSSLQARDDRLGNYLKKNFYMTDSIYFVQKFRKTFNKDLDNVVIQQPKNIEENGLDYYEYPVMIQMTASVGEVQEMLSYIEAGNMKAKVTQLNLLPFEQIDDKLLGQLMQRGSSISDLSQLYNVQMEISFYSMEKVNEDKFSEYSNNKFNDYGIDIDEADIYLGYEVNEDGTSGNANSLAELQMGSNLASGANEGVVYDFDLTLENLLAGAGNLRMIGVNRREDIVAMRADNVVEVDMNFEGLYYEVYVRNKGKNQTASMTGRLKEGDIDFILKSDVPDLPMNEKYRVNFNIKNNTDRNIKFTVKEKGGEIRRYNITDRDGNLITSSSSREKLFINVDR
jgi:hypothetical protein